jgi:pre-rRNA-processing protein IPI1
VQTIKHFLCILVKLDTQEYLIPHSPLLLLFATSAQTHIFPEIRVDAIRFLDLFLEYIPDEMVAGWTEGHGGHGNRVLEGYLGILNGGTIFGESDGI